jgi:hypothetical protein
VESHLRERRAAAHVYNCEKRYEKKDGEATAPAVGFQHDKIPFL